ncbi:MAG TPA: hypothetical protein PKX05_04165 [bacterium]|nr:hypothetical protein [bacterium]
MEDIIKRYRARIRPFLCISPEEVLQAGIVSGEETIEELILIPHPKFGTYMMFAAIVNKPIDEIQNIPILTRGERVFDNRKEAVNYIEKNGNDTFILCGVKDAKIVDRDQINGVIKDVVSNDLIDIQLQELKNFDTRNKS